MREWWNWRGRLVEAGSTTMTPLDTRTLRFSERALQVFGLVFTESEWAGSPHPGPNP